MDQVRSKGIVLKPKSVSPSFYDSNYFLQSGVGYTEGYTLATRRAKYSDVLANVQRHLPPPILDAGCGPGYIVHFLRELGIDAAGCDFSEDAMTLATTESLPYLRVANLMELPYGDRQFASTVSFHVLEHLTLKEIEIALGEISRVTRNALYCIIPTLDGAIENDAALRKQILEDPTHVSIMTRDWWVEKFGSYGWEEKGDLVRRFDRKSYGWIFVLVKTPENL